MYGRRFRQAVVLTAAVTAIVALPALARPLGPMPYQCPPCEPIANENVRIDISPAGTWVLGTTGGDPGTPHDDDKALLYGFKPRGQSTVGSGYTTMRVIGPSGTVDRVPAESVAQAVVGDRVVTAWSGPKPYRVSVTQTLRLRRNRFSGRDDSAEACFTARNLDRVPLEVGIRTLLDVKLGDNDGAPYFVPGVGAIAHETTFRGDDVPPFWVAFESRTFDPSRLRTAGIIGEGDVTRPDRFTVANWVSIQDADWEYAIHPTESVTRDSAVALYWEPATLAPGQQRTMCTQYGLASSQGGSAFLTAPIDVRCDSTIPAAVFVSNFEPTPLTGGRATLHLPSGARLARGESASKPMPVIGPGATGSVQWRLNIDPGVAGSLALDVDVAFDGDRNFSASATLRAWCPAPTPTATATKKPTRTPTPGPTATRSPHLPKVCDFVLTRVPAAVINWAVANPTRVSGWGERANPAAPPSPFNQMRTWLSLRNIAAPFHPLNNTLIYKAGCP